LEIELAYGHQKERSHASGKHGKIAIIVFFIGLCLEIEYNALIANNQSSQINMPNIKGNAGRLMSLPISTLIAIPALNVRSASALEPLWMT
jgi:hypothetical protein